MVKKRVIPCLDVADGRVVKGVNFENLREMGEPVELARRYSGLGVLPGPVRRLRARRVPHMGWNELVATRPSALLDGLDGADVYFAHSFAAEPSDDTLATATVDHDGPVVAAVESGAIAGVQFHPERSARAGARVLENLLRWSRSA